MLPKQSSSYRGRSSNSHSLGLVIYSRIIIWGRLAVGSEFRKTKCSLKCKMTSSFKIFKLLGLGSSSDNSGCNNDQQIIKKVEITSLGDDTLFLGDNYSLCVSASHFPGCQANCIYYTDDSFHVLLPFSYSLAYEQISKPLCCVLTIIRQSLREKELSNSIEFVIILVACILIHT